MNIDSEVIIRILPSQGRIVLEKNEEGVVSRKNITDRDLLQCLKNSMESEENGFHSGCLPLNTLSVYQSKTEKRLVLWHPRLYADVSLYDTPYPHFPIPRLVFAVALNNEGTVLRCRIGVAEDTVPTPETLMYHYPFSNITNAMGTLCVGNNSLPVYKKQHKIYNLPAFLLSLPNNMDQYSASKNKLGLDYRGLMEHLKDKEPAYYYSDILIPNQKTLQDFIEAT